MQIASPPVIHQCINVVILSHKKIVNIKKSARAICRLLCLNASITHMTHCTQNCRLRIVCLYLQMSTIVYPECFFGKSTKIRQLKKALENKARGFAEQPKKQPQSGLSASFLKILFFAASTVALR